MNTELGYDYSVMKPPKETIIKARYSLEENWFIAETCKRGCCIYGRMGSMVLPKYWKLGEPGDKEQLYAGMKSCGEALEKAYWGSVTVIDNGELK